MVMMMGLVDSPKFFRALSKTLMDAANAIVNTSTPITRYNAIRKTPKTGILIP